LNASDKYKNKSKRSINDMNRLVIKYPAKKISHHDEGGGGREPVAYVVQENVRKSDQLESGFQPASHPFQPRIPTKPLYNTFIYTNSIPREGVEAYGSFILSSIIDHNSTGSYYGCACAEYYCMLSCTAAAACLNRRHSKAGASQ